MCWVVVLECGGRVCRCVCACVRAHVHECMMAKPMERAWQELSYGPDHEGALRVVLRSLEFIPKAMESY